MTSGRSKKTLWWGLALIVVGLGGISMFYGAGPGPIPFAGWGGGGILDKGSYNSNGEKIYYLGVNSEGDRIPFRDGPHWLYTMGGSCVNCHGPDGAGGLPVMMGTKRPGDIRYSSLTSEEHGHGEEVEKGHRYTDEDIKRAVREGIAPDGDSLDPTMPRYRIKEKDIEDLIEYLKILE